MKPVSRVSGRSAVASAAYRSATRLENLRDGQLHDYSRKAGVEHSEIVLPQGMNADWALDRSALWNAAELAEKPDNARVAREFEVALPHELSLDAQIDLCRSFSQDLANRHGTAVDFAVHAPHVEGDIRNTHAHILMTTRAVTPEGLGAKTCIEWKNARLLEAGLPTTDMQLRDIRQAWEMHTNRHLEAAGLDMRVDHRSHVERGLEIVPTEHMGVHATQMERRGKDVTRTRIDVEAAQRNAELVREKPEQVLTIITGEKSVFDRYDVARTLHRYIHDDAQAFQSAFAAVMASPALVEMPHGRVDPATGETGPVRYSTREMAGIEAGMAEAAQRLHQARDHGVGRGYVTRAMARQDAAIARSSGSSMADGPGRGLSDEQRRAIAHVTGAARISAVIGFAGAGKSTMLAAAREAWEAQGYTVHGAALSGKAAEGLEESSGIRSRTLASWDYGWQAGRNVLGRGDVFVIDEAGMIGSRQLARFVHEAEDRGAKIVLVGDHEQLQAIGAGAAFRAIAERTGAAELSEIRRQRVDWQREASIAFATHRTGDGLAAYRDHGAIHLAPGRDEARGAIVRDYLADREERPEGSRIALAHRRADVRAINDDIRSALQERGALAKGNVPAMGEGSGELVFQTNDGKRAFAPGDRIVFLENNRDLGVKNGMLGTVENVGPDTLHIRPDRGAPEPGGKMAPALVVNMAEYQAIDHGYATTVHKSQGATVDRAFVMTSSTMDRHLTYVAMTRHRDSVQLYAGMDEFAGKRGGRQHDAGENDRDRAYARMESRLSRSGAKENTLDYTQDFAERRGIAGPSGGSRDIERARDRQQDRERPGHGYGAERMPQERTDPAAGMQEPLPPESKQRRSMFAGLRLNAAPQAEREASRGPAPVHEGPQRDRLAERVRHVSALEQSVDRFASTWCALEKMERAGLPLLEGQKAAFRQASAALDRQQPGASGLLRSGMKHDPQAERAMYDMTGRERTGQLIRGMERERAAQADPEVRADRFVERWQALQGQRQQLHGWQHDEARTKVESQMRGMAKGLERDPQVEASLRRRSRDLGISPVRQDQNVAREMIRQITPDRSRDRDHGLER